MNNKRQKGPMITVLKLNGKIVGYERWTHTGSGVMRRTTSFTIDGPETGPIPHDRRCIYRTPAKKTTGRLTADKYFTADEITSLYAAAARQGGNRGRVTEFILTILLQTGLRASELCDLKVADTPVVLGSDELRVMGKGSKVRPVPLLPETSDKIRRFVKKIRPGYVRRPMKVKDSNQPLILTETGDPYNRHLLYDRIHRLGQIAGLKKIAGTHRCRHSFATHFFRSTQDIVQLSAILGHANINTTAI